MEQIPDKLDYQKQGERSSVNKLCDLLFDRAIDQYLHGADGVIYETLTADEDHPHATTEFLPLADDETTMLLFRLAPDRFDQASFPYWLREETVGFDRHSNEPTAVYSIYLIDHQGNLHQQVEQAGHTVVIEPDRHTKIRLLSFLKHARTVKED